MKRKVTMFDSSTLNGHQHVLGDPRIFVFGSNVAGLHGGGAAWYAKNKLGAEWGVGEGLTGQTYALPTCYYPGEPVTYEELMVYVQNFIEFATAHLDLTFFVSAVGCGIAGFSESEVAPLFKDAPGNCDLPPDWRYPKCKRIIPSPIDGQFSPCSECGNVATHLFRFDYSATPGPNGRERHPGGTTLCNDHFLDDKDDPRMLNEVDLMWVKL